MARRLLRCLAPLCVLAALSPAGGRAAGADPGEVVVLPAFEVQAIRPWVIAEVPGMTVLSLASEMETQAFANRLQDVRWLTPLLLPPGTDAALTVPSSLFLRHFAATSISRRISAGLGLGYPSFAFSIFWQDTSISFPSEDAARAWRVGRDYLNIDFLRVTGLIPSAVPIWYRDGMGELLRTANLASDAVVFPQQGWRPAGATFGDNPLLGAILGPGRSPWLGLRELLALRAGKGLMGFRFKSDEERQRYLRGASLFVHWGFFDDDGRRRAAFLRFVARAAEQAPDETMLKDILGLDFKALQARLDYRGMGAVREKIPVPADRVPEPPVVAREATRGDVARIVGEAYLRLAGNVAPDAAAVYLTNAREVLEGAVEAGEGEPVIFFLLGELAGKQRDNDKAIEWLERAAAGGVRRPAAYVALAELRLQRFAALNPLSPLSAAETEAAWLLLKQADAMRPRLAGTYSLGLAMWQNSSARPGPEDLALLADGIDAFPGETTLARDALRLANKLGPAALGPAFAGRLDAWRRRFGYLRLNL